jgi:hypothetical protein
LLQDVSRLKTGVHNFKNVYNILMTKELSDSIGQDVITSNDVKIPMKTRNID